MRTIKASPKLTLERGFTLIELAIVLVIIGLIAGGVLVGQDLISAAKIRATVTQLDKYNTAVNTFQGKYNGLPGDLANPTDFFPSVTGAGSSAGLGNGNGVIESSGTDVPGLDGETAVFWYELFQAHLISENITTLGLAAQALTISDSVLPQAKIGGGNRFHATSSNGTNYFVIAGFSGATTAATGDFATIGTNLTPNQAFQIDTKIDDGLPLSGIVVSADASATANIVTAGGTSAATGLLAAGDCYDSTLSTYATDSTVTKDVNGCILRLGASF